MLIQQVVIFPAENAGGVLCQGESAVWLRTRDY